MSDRGEVTSLERVLEEIQRQIIEQQRKTLSAQVIDHAYNPRNLGRMDTPDAHAVIQGVCGDTMEFYLRLGTDEFGEEVIEDISFLTDGCGPSLACGSMLTVLVKELALEEAGKIEPEDLLAALGGLPEATAHCASLAVETLREAITNWYKSVRGPRHSAHQM